MDTDVGLGSVFRRGLGPQAPDQADSAASMAVELNSKLQELQQAWETPPQGSVPEKYVSRPSNFCALETSVTSKYMQEFSGHSCVGGGGTCSAGDWSCRQAPAEDGYGPCIYLGMIPANCECCQANA